MASFIRGRLLRWISVIGLAITIVGAFDPVLQIANFVHLIVERWHDITREFWNLIFGLLNIEVPSTIVALLNAGCFVLWLEIDAARSPRSPFSWRKQGLMLLNATIIAALFFSIIATSGSRTPNLPGELPNPAVLSNWLDQRNWFPLGVYAFAMTGFQSAIMSEPYALARRLFDVVCVLAIVLAFNYWAVYAPALLEFLKRFF